MKAAIAAAPGAARPLSSIPFVPPRLNLLQLAIKLGAAHAR